MVNLGIFIPKILKGCSTLNCWLGSSRPLIFNQRLFASRLNKQLPVFCSFRPDPEASFINAFTISWANKKLYCFPPSSCILQVLQKIIQDQATGVVVVPDWPTEACYPLLTSLLFLPPVKLHPSKNLLRLPATPTTVHPLHKNMSLLICLLSDNNLQD